MNFYSKTLCLLDRNVVSDIRNIESVPGPRADLARNCDLYTYTISPLLSSLEGKLGIMPKLEDVRTCLDEESRLLSGFYKCATIDNLFSQNVLKINKFIEILLDDKYEKHEFYAQLIRYFRSEFVEKKKLKFCENAVNHVFSLCDEFKISAGHPIVICGLSLIYEAESESNSIARKILKPSLKESGADIEKADYNALSDLLNISTLSLISATIQEEIKNDVTKAHVRYVTNDKALNTFFSLFFSAASRSILIDAGKHVHVLSNVKLNTKELFPRLAAEESKLDDLAARIYKQSQGVERDILR